MKRYALGMVAALALTFFALPVAAQVAEVRVEEGRIVFRPLVKYGKLILTLSGSGRVSDQEFEQGVTPSIPLRTRSGAALPDGTYSWRLSVVPAIDPAVREQMAKVREADADTQAEFARRLQPQGPTEQSGVFTIAGGSLIEESKREESPAPPKEPGLVMVEGPLEVTGAKRFVATDPADPSRRIAYVALEGPEAGTYYRGSAALVEGEAVVELPGHFTRVTEPEGVTVQLTPLGGWSRLYVAEKSHRRLVIRDLNGQASGEFDFLVQGVRRGFGGHLPVRPAER